MVLTLKRVQRYLIQCVDVLLCRVRGPRVFFRHRFHNAIRISNTQRLIHIPEHFVHVMHIRSLCRQLQLSLSQRNPLRLTKYIRIRYRNHVHTIIKVLGHDRLIVARDTIRILLWQALAHHTSKYLELLTHRIVQPLMHSTHDPRTLFQHSDSRANSSLLIAVAHLHVCNGREPLTRLNHKP